MPDQIETKNARIKSVFLGVEDHGHLTVMVHLDYGGGGQGFGGYSLDSYDKVAGKRVAHAACGHFVARLLETVGVEKWSDLDGKPVRVRCEWTKIHAIGHFIENKWFNPTEEFEAMRVAVETA